MKALITGGAGFIGSSLARALLEEGAEVRILDNFSTGSRENLTEVQSHVDLVDGDIRDRVVIERAVAGRDVVFHQAALGSVSRSVEDPMTTHEVNSTGTLRMLVAARDAGVERFVYASSSSVYGKNPNLPKLEDMAVDPISPYAISKLSGEQYCRVFADLYDMSTICLRYFNVFGPRQDPDSIYSAVIPLFIKASSRGEQPRIFGDGTQSRDFTFVANVVQANLKAARAEGASGLAFNIAVGRRTTLLDLVNHIARLAGQELKPIFEASRQGDVKHSLASIDAARTYLGYEPTIDLESGLAQTYAWFRNP